MSKLNKLAAIISDVDETIADLYLPAEPAMIDALTTLLQGGTKLVLVTGQGIDNVEHRVINALPASQRSNVVVGHCSGAELWGYDQSGNRRDSTFYSRFTDRVSRECAEQWRVVVAELIHEFKLEIWPVMPVGDFMKIAGNAPWNVMFEDRGPQITLEFINAFNMSPAQHRAMQDRVEKPLHRNDLRVEVKARAEALLQPRKVSISPRLAGVFALDFAVAGVTKTDAVKAVCTHQYFEQPLPEPVDANAHLFEVWGDRFSIWEGTDWHMSVALPQRSLSISFRDEDPASFPEDYNVRLWQGKSRLHRGMLEYLQTELQ